jgi:tetratricopeptide (TPR) repeat protein
MKATFRFATAALALGMIAAAIPRATAAQGKDHPAYLRALSDLRQARAYLQRPDQGVLKEEEKRAIRDIDSAIEEIKKAAIDDGKDLNDHPPVDAKMEWKGRLHQAVELLDRAHRDVTEDEDNRFAQGLQQRAKEQIARARQHVEDAIKVAGYK